MPPGQAVEEQQLWDLLRASDRRRQQLTHWALAARTGSFQGHLFSSFWFGSPPSPTGGVPSNEKWQELQVQSSQSPQGLRTPRRHWSLMALSSLLPFPLKETAAPGAQGTLHISASGLQFPADLCLLLLPAGWDFPLWYPPPTEPPTIYSAPTGGSRQYLPGKPKEIAA